MAGMFPKDVLDFFAGVRRLSDRARERNELGRDGEPIWSEVEWATFCKGARAYKHMSFFGAAIVNTVTEVEAMLADGFSAQDIHNVLLGNTAEKERKLLAASRVAHRMWDPA